MDRHRSSKGFTLAEVCVVLMILSLFVLFYLPVHAMNHEEFYLFLDRYLYTQSQAIAKSEEKEVETEGYVLHFNQRGNVRYPITLEIRNRKVIVELGGGRLVLKS